MYILLNGESLIVAMSETLNFQKNGNALIHQDTKAVATSAFKTIEEVKEVPSEVEPFVYYYKDGKFIRNEKYSAEKEAEIAGLQKTIDEQADVIAILEGEAM